MNRIETTALAKIARLAYFLKPRATMDGKNSHAKTCHLSLTEDGKFQACLTDSEFAFVSRFPITGDMTPWKAPIQMRLAKLIFPAVSRITLGQKKKKSTSRANAAKQREVKVSVEDMKTLELERGQFKTVLPAVTFPNAFPSLEIPNDDAWTTMTRGTFQEALGFVARHPGKEDTENDSLRCSIFKDGHVVSFMHGLNVIARNFESAVEPVVRLPFDLSTTLHHATRLLAWLEWLPTLPPEEDGSNQIQVAASQGEDFYYVRDLRKEHLIRVPSSLRMTSWERFNQMRGTPITIGVIVDRLPVLSTMRLAHKVAMKNIICTLKQGSGGGWRLTMSAPDESGCIHVENGLSVKCTASPPEGTAEISFRVAPARLALAAHRLTGAQITLSYRESAKLVGVGYYSTVAILPEGCENEIFFTASTKTAKPEQEEDEEDEEDDEEEDAGDDESGDEGDEEPQDLPPPKQPPQDKAQKQEKQRKSTSKGTARRTSGESAEMSPKAEQVETDVLQDQGATQPTTEGGTGQ